MDFEFLYRPAEELDHSLSSMLDGAPLAVALVLAVVLGLRHASDPDHLVAVTSLVAAEDRGTRDAARLGVWWGLGHATTLLVIGLPLIILSAELPAGLESAAEKAIGVVIALLAARVVWKWVRGDYRPGRHRHGELRHRHLAEGEDHGHGEARTPGGAFAIGVLHGLAGSGAVVLLLLAALESQVEAASALALFAPMSVISMAGCTAAFAWVLTRPAVAPVYRRALVPALGVFGLMFGLWFAGLS